MRCGCCAWVFTPPPPLLASVLGWNRRQSTSRLIGDNSQVSVVPVMYARRHNLKLWPTARTPGQTDCDTCRYFKTCMAAVSLATTRDLGTSQFRSSASHLVNKPRRTLQLRYFLLDCSHCRVVKYQGQGNHPLFCSTVKCPMALSSQ